MQVSSYWGWVALRMQSNSAPSLPLVYSYGLVVVFVALALLTSLALEHSFGSPFWFIFSVAVILSTWFGRSGVGWFAVVCSGLCVVYFFTPPLRSFAASP
jgi:K+-sensing histidine kinase KdpD